MLALSDGITENVCFHRLTPTINCYSTYSIIVNVGNLFLPRSGPNTEAIANTAFAIDWYFPKIISIYAPLSKPLGRSCSIYLEISGGRHRQSVASRVTTPQILLTVEVLSVTYHNHYDAEASATSSTL
jgi:hypothetical protein